MSVNTSRAKLNKANNGREYHILWVNELYPDYWDEGIHFHSRRTTYSRVGSKSYLCWKRKEVTQFEYRMYRSWKYNRKNQWK